MATSTTDRSGEGQAKKLKIDLIDYIDIGAVEYKRYDIQIETIVNKVNELVDFCNNILKGGD